LLAAALFALLGITDAAAQQADSGWRFGLTPYLWLPNVDYTLRFDPPPAGGGDTTVESTESYLSNLDMAVMLNLEARKGEWAIVSDFIYLDFSSDDASMKVGNGPVQVPVSSSTRSDLTGGLWQLVASRALARSEQWSFEVLGGVRYLAIKASASWQLTGPVGVFPQAGTLSQKEELWDGIVGVRGRIGLGAGRWFAPYYVDAGTGSSDLTWQALAGIGYAFEWGDLLLAYRHLSYEQGDDNLVQNLSFSGPGLGATFRF
jgi:hypothetical protein